MVYTSEYDTGEKTMKYNETITLKNGKTAVIRNGEAADGEEVLYVFDKTHEETDFLYTYPGETDITAEEEGKFLQGKTDSDNEVELLAIVDGKVVGIAGFGAEGNKFKVRHRADFGISILKDYWGLGIGSAMTKACIECAKDAGYTQLELNVVSENEAAISLYKKMGFIEYGRNPRGFNSKFTGYQEVVYMRLEL